MTDLESACPRRLVEDENIQGELIQWINLADPTALSFPFALDLVGHGQESDRYNDGLTAGLCFLFGLYAHLTA